MEALLHAVQHTIGTQRSASPGLAVRALCYA